MYKCKYCGREFEKRHQLIGHVAWCKEKPGYSEKAKKKQLEEARSKIKFHKSNSNYTKDLTEYTCQYCSRSCIGKNSLVQHEIRCKQNPNKIKVVSGFIKYNKENTGPWNKGLTKETDERVAKGANTLKENYKNGKAIPPFLGKNMSDEHKQKISKSRKKYLEENPDKVPYLLNHSSKISVPEQYFIEVFAKENIPLKFHKQISLYQLDFYNETKMFYLEIDGEQHYQAKSIERDKKRCEYLTSLGWKGLRIRWSIWQKLNITQKQKIINKIKNILA